MTVENTLAYYYKATITTVKVVIVQAPGADAMKQFTAVIYFHSWPILWYFITLKSNPNTVVF